MNLFTYVHKHILNSRNVQMLLVGRGIKYYVGKKLQCLKVELVCSLQKKKCNFKQELSTNDFEKDSTFFLNKYQKEGVVVHHGKLFLKISCGKIIPNKEKIIRY